MSKNDKSTNSTIFNCLKTAQVASLISTICMVIGTVIILITDNVSIGNSSRSDSFTESIATFCLLTFCGIAMQFITIVRLSNSNINKLAEKYTLIKEFGFLIFDIITSSPIIYVALLMIFYPIGFSFYLTGAVYNVGLVTIIVMHIAMLKAYVALKKESEEKIKKMPQYIGENNEIKEANTLLNKCGKNFFIKYYYLLKNWETADILDEINENYEDSTKFSKIETGKKLFAKKLNIVALKIIVNSPNETIKADIKNNANKILEEEKTNEGKK